jgi:pyruvate, orthophosphate dikinase
MKKRISPLSGSSSNEIGIYGEHGGEPSSVQFCYRVGMNYVSCSPYSSTVTRLAMFGIGWGKGAGPETT